MLRRIRLERQSIPRDSPLRSRATVERSVFHLVHHKYTTEIPETAIAKIA